MIPQKILDDRGEICTVYLLPRFSTKRMTDGSMAVQGAIQLPCGDSYMTWFPVFTEWWT